MTGTNHAMTGGVIGLAIGGPIAIPFAFVAHFALDAMPHLGYEEVEDRIKNRNTLLKVIAVDGVMGIIVIGLAIASDVPWYVYASMIACMSPDFVWGYRFVFEEKFGKLKPGPLSGLNKFHSDIQTRESPQGIFIEIAWFVLMFFLAYKLV
jgi:hypothetical protein